MSCRSRRQADLGTQMGCRSRWQTDLCTKMRVRCFVGSRLRVSKERSHTCGHSAYGSTSHHMTAHSPQGLATCVTVTVSQRSVAGYKPHCHCSTALRSWLHASLSLQHIAQWLATCVTDHQTGKSWGTRFFCQRCLTLHTADQALCFHPGSCVASRSMPDRAQSRPGFVLSPRQLCSQHVYGTHVSWSTHCSSSKACWCYPFCWALVWRHPRSRRWEDLNPPMAFQGQPHCDPTSCCHHSAKQDRA